MLRDHDRKGYNSNFIKSEEISLLQKEEELIATLGNKFECKISLVPQIQPNIVAHLENLEVMETKFGTDFKNGLSRTVAEHRRSLYGSNSLNLPSTSIFKIFRGWLPSIVGLILSKFLEQFMQPLIGLLLISSVVSLILGQVENAVSIGVAVFIVGTVGFIQEYRTEKSLEALKRLAPPRCRVIRDGGRVWEILAEEIVVGDILDLVMGDRIPADSILITATDFQVDESILTGENRPVKKKSLSSLKNETETENVNESIQSTSTSTSTSIINKVMMGTLVRQGRARGLVTAIGLKTEFGRLAILMHETEERRSPLQIRLDHLGNQLTIYSVGVIILISLAGLFLQHRSFIETFTVAVSLAVAAIPEGLPIVATITLALGVLRLAQRGVVVKKLPAVEALGSMSVFCADKTGTLTLNEMAVEAVYSVETEKLYKENEAEKELGWLENCPKLAQIAWTCNDAILTSGNEGRWQGNSTDIALKKFIEKVQRKSQSSSSASKGQKFNLSSQVIESFPFNSSTKMMAIKLENGEWLIKGAAEILMSRGTQSLKLITALEELNSKGYRVIALGISETGPDGFDLKIVGLIALVDPCRTGMREMVTSLHSARIQTIMITGDSKESAQEVGLNIGWIKSRDSSTSIMSGDEMIKNSAIALQSGTVRSFLNGLAIVYRATPEQKLQLVKLLQGIDNVVGMTGDGVNDAPALKLADIGIAMGGSNGSDVAREAANIIMTDDDLSRVIEGIAEGRAIFCNIRHFVRFQLGVSVAALGLVSLTTILHLAPPLTALQILLINIIMDGPPAQSLGVEPTTKKSIACLLGLPPVESNAQILSKGMIIQTAVMAGVMITCTLLGYPFARSLKMESPVLLTYATFVTCTMVYALTCRSSTRSVLFSLPSGGPFSNSFLNVSLIITGVMLTCTCCLTIFRGSVAPLTPQQWSLPVATVVILVLVDELVKILGRFFKNVSIFSSPRIIGITSYHKPTSCESSCDII